MSEHGVDMILDEINGLNEEAENFIDKIEHMRMEEDKIDEIINEDRHYDGEDGDFRRTSTVNCLTGVE